MPSWPTRLLHGSPPTNNQSSPPVLSSQGHSITKDRQRDVQRQAKALADGPALALASSSADAPPARALQHGRSVSHSFLSSLATHGEKVKKSKEVNQGGVENLDGLIFSVTPSSLSTNAQTDTIHKTATQRRDIDLVSGKCATCDSLVRWPRHLDVFRCAVCLMVNDLKQTTITSSKDRGCLLDPQVEFERIPGARKWKPGTQRAESRNFSSNARDCSYTHISCQNQVNH